MINSTNNCRHCNKPILIGDKRKKFCNLSCSASYNNAKSPKRKAEVTSQCKNCQTEIILKKKPKGGYYTREYCDSCLNLKKVYQLTGSCEQDLLVNQTKGSLYDRRKDWQSANSSIRNNARKVYSSATLPSKTKKCFVSNCKWDNFFEVAHLDSVSSFSNDSKVTDINSIENLIALCPNHHWEYDNGDFNKLIFTLGNQYDWVKIQVMITGTNPIGFWSGDGFVFLRHHKQGLFRRSDGTKLSNNKYCQLLIVSDNFPLKPSDSENFSIENSDGSINETINGSVILSKGPIIIIGF